jgi:peroxiredoxin
MKTVAFLDSDQPLRGARALVCGAALALAALPALANVEPGTMAPDFSVKDLAGKDRKLSEFKGKTVVLEWHNPNCPFVKKHYDSANMQGLQGGYGERGVVWLAINSTNPNASDYMTPAALGSWLADKKAKPTAYLMDESGKVGKQYGAKTTPHMWVIDASGKVVYAGGIDDKRSTRVDDVATAKNFVRAALDETLAGKPVTVASATPYGCTVKY